METKLPGLIRFGRELCGDLAQAERREWWLSNGLGGYSAGTVAGTLTRRYHGLLVAPVHPPLGRHVVMAKADATLRSDGREWPLFSNRWSGGAVVPAGYLDIETFQLDGDTSSTRYTTRPPILMNCGPSPVQRHRSNVRCEMFQRAATSIWFRCLIAIWFSYGFCRKPAENVTDRQRENPVG